MPDILKMDTPIFEQLRAELSVNPTNPSTEAIPARSTKPTPRPDAQLPHDRDTDEEAAGLDGEDDRGRLAGKPARPTDHGEDVGRTAIR